MNQSILLETGDAVATITLNRPDELNTMDLPALEALVAALDQAAADPRARVVVLAARGGRPRSPGRRRGSRQESAEPRRRVVFTI